MCSCNKFPLSLCKLRHYFICTNASLAIYIPVLGFFKGDLLLAPSEEPDEMDDWVVSGASSSSSLAFLRASIRMYMSLEWSVAQCNRIRRCALFKADSGSISLISPVGTVYGPGVFPNSDQFLPQLLVGESLQLLFFLLLSCVFANSLAWHVLARLLLMGGARMSSN